MPSQRIPELPFVKTTLPNGLDVIVRRQGDLPIVAVNLWYHVGSKNEAPRQKGFAHLFEHLMFEGSEHYPHDFFKPLQRVGGNINGSTSTDRTNYFVDLPTAHLELALAMESDRMGHFLPTLSAEKLRIQKDVVKNEYRQNYANRPYGQVWRLLAEALYPPGHPYSWTTIGLMEDVEAAGLDDVEGFFRRFYVPANSSLAIVGDVDETRALALAERYFGPIPGGTKAARPHLPPVDSEAASESILHDKVELERFYVVWHTVPQFHPDDAALDAMADVLSRGKASRLYRKLVMERQLLQDVSAYHSSRELAGTFGVVGTLRPGVEAATAREAIDREIADIAAYGLKPEELERVKNARFAGFIYSLDNVGGFGGVADRLNAYNTYLGDPSRIRRDLEECLALSVEQLTDVARRYVDARPRTGLLVTGRKPTASLPPLDRKTPPGPAPAVGFRPPTPIVATLRCGIPLWVVPRRDLPMAAGSFVLPAGAANHSADRGGLANLTSALLDEGTTTRSTHDLAMESEFLGSHISGQCGWDGAYVNLQSLSQHLDKSFELAVDILLHPTFPENEFVRIKGQTLTSLRAERDRAEALASRAFLQAIYGDHHPFAVPIEGSERSVGSFERGDLLAFFKSFHVPEGSACVIAGDVDPDELAKRLDALLEGWASRPLPASALPPSEPADGGTLIVVDRPGAAQAVVRVGHVGVRRLDPDYMALQVANHILGGQFTSRLNAKLREEKGYTYGVRSQFDFRKTAGPFHVAASLQSDRLADAIADLRHEVHAFLDHRPPVAHEIDDAKRSLIEGQARHFETPNSLVSRFAGLLIHGLPPDHHASFEERVEAVTPSIALEAARRHIRPDDFVTVVAADASQVLEPLKTLGWSSIRVRDPKASPLS